jgi:peptide/nickel transport system ATP-binding protein
MLTVTRLTITFPDAPPVVNQVSFTLAPGERLGLLGLSGSGKSLTALALLGMLPERARVISGEIVYTPAKGAAVNLLQLSEREWRTYRGREISLIFQEPLTALNPVHRVGQQLLEGVRHLRPELTTTATQQQCVREWLGRVELGEEAERILRAFPHQLSGGQRQRLLIALALIGQPRLLIADEPTTALDTITETGVLQLLARLHSELGMATIFITHDLRVMERSAEQCLVMAGGEIVRRLAAGELGEEGEAVFEPATAVGEKIPLPPACLPPSPAVLLNGVEVPAATPPETAITVTNLCLSYANQKAWPWSAAVATEVVHDVSFDLKVGEWLAIVGPSGCGKTSVARSLAGLLPTAAGLVKLAAGGNVQMVFQDPFSSLNPAHGIARSLIEVLRVHYPAKDKGWRRTEAERLLRSVGLPPNEYADRKPNALSGGQRQRVAIARALAGRPTVLICDEAVSALDVPLRKDVLDLLDVIRRERGISLLFISHDLALVADRADRVVIMDAGRIVESGPADAVLAKPKSEMGKRLVAVR